MKWERDFILFQRQLEGYEELNKRITASQRDQQFVLDSCIQRLENCEDMKASIQKLTDAMVEIRRRPETQSTSSWVAARLTQNRCAMARSVPTVPEDPRSANFGAKSGDGSPLNEPVHADRFSLRPQFSMRQRRLVHPTR